MITFSVSMRQHLGPAADGETNKPIGPAANGFDVVTSSVPIRNVTGRDALRRTYDCFFILNLMPHRPTIPEPNSRNMEGSGTATSPSRTAQAKFTAYMLSPPAMSGASHQPQEKSYLHAVLAEASVPDQYHGSIQPPVAVVGGKLTKGP